FASALDIVALFVQTRTKDLLPTGAATVLPWKHSAIALPVNQHAALGTPGIPGAAGGGDRGAEHKGVDEASGDYGNVHEEERVVVFIDSEIRPEHFVGLLADHADDRPFLVVRAGN